MCPSEMGCGGQCRIIFIEVMGSVPTQLQLFFKDPVTQVGNVALTKILWWKMLSNVAVLPRVLVDYTN